MKKSITLFVATIIIFVAQAQNIEISEQQKEIDNIPRKGMSAFIELDKKFVESQWEKKLKDFHGKKSHQKGAIFVENATISEISSNPIQIISTVESDKKSTEIWWALDLGTAYVTKDASKEWKSAEDVLREFCKQAYIEDVNLQIADAEKALEKTTKEYDKKVSHGEWLVKEIDKNGKEKIELENKLKDNAEELTNLNQDVVKNKEEQSEAQKEVEKMKKAVETVRSKLNAIK